MMMSGDKDQATMRKALELELELAGGVYVPPAALPGASAPS